MDFMQFNRTEYLWRNDIDDSIVIYKMGGEKVYQLTGEVKKVFIMLVEKPSDLESGDLKNFFLENEIFRSVTLSE